MSVSAVLTVVGLVDKYGDDVAKGLTLIAAGLNIVNKWGLSEEEVKQVLSKYRDEEGNVVREPTPAEVAASINDYRMRVINRWQDVS